MSYALRFKIDTWLKQGTGQGASLPDSQRQFIEAETVLPVSGFLTTGSHLKITLGQDEQGKQIFYKGRNTWFVYEPAIEVLQAGQVIDPQTREPLTPAYTMRIDLDTWLKQSTAQSSSLPDDQKQFVQAGTTLPVSSFAVAGQFHLKLALGVDPSGQQVSFKGRNTWYVYRPVIEMFKDGAPFPIPAPTRRGPEYTLSFQNDSFLKLSTAQSSALPDDQKQFITAGTVLPLSSYGAAGQAHLRVALGLDANGKQVLFKGRNTWFAYEPAVAVLRDGRPIQQSLAGKTIVLDPGHGEVDSFGNDPGAVNRPLNRNERDEVRKQATIIQQTLSAKGATVRIVENNSSLSLGAIGAQGRGADCFVSLHLNAFNQSAQGHEVLVHREATATDVRLATLVNQALAANLAIRDRGVKRQGLGVLAGVPLPTPAILTEAFFIDSVADVATLDQWNNLAAQAIAQGIERFLTQ
ncbi:MAG: N-acetylmuramoyl-L-alanine amidase [Cyanobacteria bacterium P01_H01_bin.121]